MAKDRKKRKSASWRKEEEEERRRWHDDLRPETKRSVWAIVSFVVATILLLAWFGKAGLAGEGISSFFTLLFGNAFLVVPIAFLLAGLSFLLGMRQRVFGGTFFGALLFLISVLGLGEIFGGSQTGGYIGSGIAFVPLRFFDVAVSIVLFSAFLVISFLLMFNVAFVRRSKDELDVETEKEGEGENIVSGVESEKQGFFARLNPFGKKKQDTDIPVHEPAGVADETETNNVLSAEASPMNDFHPHATDGKEVLDEDEALHKKPMVSPRVPSNYIPPTIDLLEKDRGKPSSGDVRANANIIQRTLQNFGIDVDMGEVNVGPSVTQYTLKPAEGIKLSRITNLSSNLGLALAAHPLRMEAPIPGRSLIGIEVPNQSIAFVGLRNLLAEYEVRKNEYVLGFALGRDVTGRAVFSDLARMPHLLIAGSTGSGKSVTIHSLLMGLLFANPPEILRLLLIDPKRVELSYYNGAPHLMTPVITDAKKAIQALRWATKEMERRYEQLQAAGARDIISYNTDTANKDIMPYLVLVIDELADLMATYPREVESAIVRLAQMARAVGIHLVVSTQRPSVDVITGLIKANITTRIALQVVSQIDSRTILDMAGAEKLLGRGDMLYLPGDAAKPRRIQGVYISDQEVKRVTRYLRELKESTVDEIAEDDIFSGVVADNAMSNENGANDELYEEARDLVIESGKASTSLLQRRLRLGYARAARLIDMLEERGVVGPGEGAKPREILIHKDIEEKLEAEVHET
jgi:DNA segregation ATPase FtsK/SpoIIIE, S-DNA-T family